MPKKAIFDKKNILVAGGAGFIGSHLCDELVKFAKVICLDNFITGDENNISHLYQNSNFVFVNHDITMPIDLEKLPELAKFKINFQGIQEIYSLASPDSPKFYLAHPIETLLANSCGLKNTLDLAVKYKARILYASSPAVYGEEAGGKLVKEDFVGRVNQIGSRACYSEAKRFGETLVDNYRKTKQLDAKIVRIFNCYGPRLKLEDGRMIPEIIKLALAGKEVVIYGEKNSVGSYFYISDLTKALIKMMESVEAGPINIGSDWKNSFGEIAEKIIKLAKSNSKIKYEKSEFSVPQCLPDISLAKEKLGWFPIILLDEGLKETIDYLSAQQNLLEPRE